MNMWLWEDYLNLQEVMFVCIMLISVAIRKYLHQSSSIAYALISPWRIFHLEDVELLFQNPLIVCGIAPKSGGDILFQISLRIGGNQRGLNQPVQRLERLIPVRSNLRQRHSSLHDGGHPQFATNRRNGQGRPGIPHTCRPPCGPN